MLILLSASPVAIAILERFLAKGAGLRIASGRDGKKAKLVTLGNI